MLSGREVYSLWSGGDANGHDSHLCHSRILAKNLVDEEQGWSPLISLGGGKYTETQSQGRERDILQLEGTEDATSIFWRYTRSSTYLLSLL